MPPAVIVAVVCDSAMLLLACLGFLLNVLVLNPLGACGVGLRAMLIAAVLFGYFQRNMAARWCSIICSALGLLGCLTCAIGFIAMSDHPAMQQRFPDHAAAILLISFVVQSVFWVTILISLLHPSAADYFDS